MEQRPVVVTAELVSPLVQDFVSDEGAALAEVTLSHLFRVYPELGPVCVECTSEDPSTQPALLVRALQRYGILRADGRSLNGDLIAAGLRLHTIELGTAPASNGEAVGDEEREGTLPIGEWAEELALLSKQRNLLERRLRDLVLGFLRYDSLKHRDKPSVHDRILAAVPESRRSKLAPYTADEMLHSLYWLELTSLVRREWNLFQDIFGSKKDFEHHCDIVNDRPDTHAKDLDLAEFALQRRSLKWLDERITPQ
jgi:hypothetical protein